MHFIELAFIIIVASTVIMFLTSGSASFSSYLLLGDKSKAVCNITNIREENHRLFLTMCYLTRCGDALVCEELGTTDSEQDYQLCKSGYSIGNNITCYYYNGDSRVLSVNSTADYINFMYAFIICGGVLIFLGICFLIFSLIMHIRRQSRYRSLE